MLQFSHEATSRKKMKPRAGKNYSLDACLWHPIIAGQSPTTTPPAHGSLYCFPSLACLPILCLTSSLSSRPTQTTAHKTSQGHKHKHHLKPRGSAVGKTLCLCCPSRTHPVPLPPRPPPRHPPPHHHDDAGHRCAARSHCGNRSQRRRSGDQKWSHAPLCCCNIDGDQGRGSLHGARACGLGVQGRDGMVRLFGGGR